MQSGAAESTAYLRNGRRINPMRAIIAIAALLFGLAIPGGSASAAGKQDFTLLNKTGYRIDKVYVSPAASDDWEEDVLGRDVLDDGESVDISFHREATGCKWDLKVVYADDDSSAIWHGFDICSISKITIRYNRKTDTTSAVTE
jgi:hypothetical protein